MTQTPPTQPLELVDPRGVRILLTGAELIAGRSQECTIRLVDELASRRHFALRHSPFGWQLSDLGSSNGTFVNDRRLQYDDRWLLSPGDRIMAGTTTLLVREAAQPIATPAAERAGRPSAATSPRRLPGAGRRAAIPAGPPGGQLAGQQHRSPVERVSGARSSASPSAWRWAVTVNGALAMGLLLVSAFSPWVRIEAGLALANVPGGEIIAGAARIVQGLVQTVLGTPQPTPAAQAGPATLRLLEQTVGGMDTHAYGLVVLAIAIATAITLVLDIALAPAQRGAIGLVYLLLGLGPGVLFVIEYARFDQLTHQPVLFGLDLATLFRVSQQLVDIQVRPLIGLWLLAAGLLLVSATGFLRILLPFLLEPRGPGSLPARCG